MNVQMNCNKVVQISATIICTFVLMFIFHMLIKGVHEIGNEIMVNQYHQEPKVFEPSYRTYFLLCPILLVVSFFLVKLGEKIYSRFLGKSK